MPNRYLCDVLDEMRKCNETRNYSYLLGLIEEAQMLGNRMEAALEDRRDLATWRKKVSEEKAEYKKLLAETNELRKKLKKEEKEMPTYP